MDPIDPTKAASAPVAEGLGCRARFFVRNQHGEAALESETRQ